jgi:hypothetical protein
MIVDRLGVSYPSGWPFSVAALSNVRVCGHWIAKIADSNPTGSTDV